MPNYSKKGHITYSASNRSIDNIPWHELDEIHKNSQKEANEAKQAKLDYDYKKFIDELEREYAENNEAPYEGNFSDKHKRPVANLSPLQIFNHVKEQIVERVKLLQIGTNIDWIMPQLLTLLGGMKITKNSNGLISGLQFRNENIVGPKLRGIYWFLMIDQRSTYLKLQYKAPHRAYCALVPIIPYAVRLVQGIPYSAWDEDEIQYVVNPALAAAMKCTYPDFTTEQLIEQRNQGLNTPATGVMKNPQTTAKLSGPQLKLETNIFLKVPELAQVMLTQIWCAHPANRTQYMVLDPYDWDAMPKPLITTDVVKVLTETEPEPTDQADNWGQE